jgi:hypothetical protein
LGATYYYKVAARNAVGLGTYSASVSLVAPNLPVTMATPTLVSRAYDQIVIAWTPLATDAETGRCTITHYSLRARLSTQSLETDWVYITGSNNYLGVSATHTGFSYDVTYNYQIRAVNIMGAALVWSGTLSVPTSKRPAMMSQPTSDLVTPTQIRLNWVTLTTELDRGYEPITAYQL